MDIQRIAIYIGLAVVSYLMILAWNEDYHQPATTPVASESVQSPSAELEAPITNNGGQDQEFSTPESSNQTSLTSASEPGTTSRDLIRVRTDVLDLAIDPVGGQLVEARLLQYDKTLNSAQPLTLLRNDQQTYILESGLIGRDGFDSSKNGPAPVYQTELAEYTLADGEEELVVPLTYTSDAGVEVIKEYRFNRNSYEIGVDYEILNNSEAAWQGNFSGKIIRDFSPDPTAQTSFGIQAFLGLVISSKDDPYEKFDLSDLREDRINEAVTNGWMAFLQHYFLTAWIPSQDVTQQFQTTQRNNLMVMGFVSPATTVEPGQSATVGARAYVGPKIIDRLENVAPNLDRTVDFGFLFFIALPLFYILEWFHSLVGNWGVAIILLTVLVKAVFFHLSATSYRSMARMRAVAPQLTRLRELYGDDRQRMSQEMMSLYKKEKINPLGGCLPILVQMPVFIALYWVLFESVQLRHAPFVFYIQDLSVMDPYFILPILMGASMFLQMHLNPTPPDPMQAKVMKLMPLIFTVFFLWFPAGLVLYWLVNNILSISQQWYITRKIEAEKQGKKA